MKINGRLLSETSPPYLIAEISCNHNGSISNALNTIQAAKLSGADAVKIQTYTPDTMTINCDRDQFRITGGLWDGYKLYDLYRQAHTPYEWHPELFTYAKKVGITLFSTPFDESAVELLESCNTPAYKIASFELNDLPLVEVVARTRKPLFISTGMASYDEIAEALEVARTNGCNEILLFHCISAYPAPIDQSNLLRVKRLKEEFSVEVGLSDHSIGTLASAIAISMGAVAIEKHFTLDKSISSPDSQFSIEPEDFSNLKKECMASWSSIGTGDFVPQTSELDNLRFRRSLYFVKNLKAGHVISETDIRRIRPGFGLPPKYYYYVLGKTLLHDVQIGEPLTMNCISE